MDEVISAEFGTYFGTRFPHAIEDRAAEVVLADDVRWEWGEQRELTQASSDSSESAVTGNDALLGVSRSVAKD